MHAGELVGAVFLRDQQPEAQGGQPGAQCASVAAVSGDAVVQALLQHQPQRLAQGVDHAHGRRVVVHAGPAGPVLEQQPQVQVPAAALLGPSLYGLEPPGADGHGRHPGRRAQALLRRAVGEVDVNVVEVHAGAAEGGHCVDEEKGVVVVGQLAEVAQRLEHPGRGLGVDSGQQLHLRLLLEDCLDCVGVGGLAPLHRYGDDLCPLARSDLRKAQPKKAILDDDGHVARLQEVGERRLHARGACAGDGEGEGVLRAVDLTQHLRDAVHDLDELGVQVAKDGR